MTPEDLEQMKVPTLTDEEWEKGKELARDWCRGGLGSKSLMPHLFIWFTQDRCTPGTLEFSPVQLFLMACGFDWNNESKRWFIRQVAAKMVREKCVPVAIIFAHEAWQSHHAMPPGLTDEQKRQFMLNRPMPSDDPNSIEVVCAAGLRVIGADGCAKPLDPHDRNGWHWSQKVKRDSEDNMLADGDPVEGNDHTPLLVVRLLHQFALYATKMEPLPPEGDGGKLTTIKPE